jgi:hypothetical protein
MNGIEKSASIMAVLLLAIMVVPACALEGSMGPARMTLRTEVPFMSLGAGSVIEVPVRVCNTANESESVRFFITDDLNNSDIMRVKFAEEHLVLMPEEERVVTVTFTVKKPGSFSGNIVTVFNSLNEESSSTIGSMVGLRLNSKVSIVAERKGPDSSLYTLGGAVGFAGIVLLIGVILHRRKQKEREEYKK